MIVMSPRFGNLRLAYWDGTEALLIWCEDEVARIKATLAAHTMKD